MIKAWLKKGGVTLSYWIGLTRAMVKVGDFLEFNPSPFFLPGGQKRQEKFLILIYHRVNDQKQPLMIERVPTRLFEQQMKYLARFFDVLPLEVILDHLQSGQTLPKRCVAITFDDGYKDNYLNAFPILKKYKLPATIFLTSGCLDTGENLWFDLVLYAFEHTSRRMLKLPGERIALAFDNPLEKARVAFRILNRLMSSAPSIRFAEIDAIYSGLSVKRPGKMDNQMLNWREVKEMAEAGIGFGSHTMNHEILTNIPLREAEKQLIESKELIESRIHRKVRVFAYPNGKAKDYSPEIIGLIKESGYEGAVTTIQGLNFRQQDPYQFRRIKPWGYALPQFAMSLTYHYIMDNIEKQSE